MASIIPNITLVSKRYGVVVEDQVMMNSTEIGDYLKLFPEKKSHIVYVDVLEINGSHYILGSNAMLVSVANISPVEVSRLFDEDNDLFNPPVATNKSYGSSSPSVSV